VATDYELIDDVETLREVARLQAQEIADLRAAIAKLARENAALKGQDADRQLALRLAELEQQLARLQKQTFGDSSEKRPASTVADKEETGAQPPPQRGHGPRPQPTLPVIEHTHELGERQCPTCAGVLEPMTGQTEDADEVSLVERQYVVVRHRRQKYRCRCNAAVVTAPGPRKLVAGGRYSLEFAVDVAVAKYADHMPLERQVKVMARHGLVVDSQTLWDQTDLLAHHLVPTYQALQARALAAEVAHADETWWRMMDRKSLSKWWAWCMATDDSVVYRILPSRSAKAAAQLLAGYSGVIVADGYGAYDALTRAGPGITLAHCWAHVRRKFVDIEKFYPVEAKHALDLIGRLYALEHTLPSWTNKASAARASALSVRAHIRAEGARPVIDELRDWAYAQKGTRESGLRKAIEYMLGLWPGLTRFVDDPRIPLDNNPVERALRGSVVGRKNHYGSRSQRGTEVAALFYSLLETASLCGEDESAYLRRAAVAAIDDPSNVILPTIARE
jgi:transposase